MTTFVVLLRGINVGGHRKVPMATLRDAFARAGFADVRSYIQSGNLVLTSPAKAEAAVAKMERAIHAEFGFPVDVIARTTKQWSAYVAGNPLLEAAENEPNRVMLLLSAKPPKAGAVSALRERATQKERVEESGDGIWIHYPQGAGKSKLAGAILDRIVASPVTARNWTTVLTLDAMACGEQ